MIMAHTHLCRVYGDTRVEDYPQDRGHDQGGGRSRDPLRREGIGLPGRDVGGRYGRLIGILAARRVAGRRAPKGLSPAAGANSEGPLAAVASGTVLIAPHSGHWACRPTVPSSVRNNLPHRLQRNSIAIEYLTDWTMENIANCGERGNGREAEGRRRNPKDKSELRRNDEIRMRKTETKTAFFSPRSQAERGNQRIAAGNTPTRRDPSIPVIPYSPPGLRHWSFGLFSSFGFRHWNFGLPSSFGLRHSDFPLWLRLRHPRYAMGMFSPSEILGPGGRIAARLPNYEHRGEQLAMAEAVDRAIRQQHHLVVEAGTGVGKSFAYLVPAILAAGGQPRQAEDERATRKWQRRWSERGGQSHFAENRDSPRETGQPDESPHSGQSRKSGQSPCRVVVSTHTISLQEQLMQKDLPLLHSVIPVECSAVLVKGRGNYLSLRRLHNAMSRAAGLFSETEEFEQLDRLVGLVEEDGRRLAGGPRFSPAADGLGRGGQRSRQLHGPGLPEPLRVLLLQSPAADAKRPDPGGQSRPVLHRPGPAARELRHPAEVQRGDLRRGASDRNGRRRPSRPEHHQRADRVHAAETLQRSHQSRAAGPSQTQRCPEGGLGVPRAGGRFPRRALPLARREREKGVRTILRRTAAYGSPFARKKSSDPFFRAGAAGEHRRQSA